MTKIIQIKQPRFVQVAPEMEALHGSPDTGAIYPQDRRKVPRESVQFLDTLIRDLERNEQERARQQRSADIGFLSAVGPMLLTA